MANLGRAYPRAFNRDFSFYRDQRFLDYLPRRLQVICSGTNWNISGWPTTLMITEEAVPVWEEKLLRWEIARPVGAHPASYFQIDWILTQQSNWWRCYWKWQANATQWFYNDLTVYGNNPSNFPRVLGGPWKDRFGVDTFAVGITHQAIGTWANEP